MDVSSSARAHPARHRASTHRIYDASSGQVLVKVIAVSFFEIGLLAVTFAGVRQSDLGELSPRPDAPSQRTTTDRRPTPKR